MTAGPSRLHLLAQRVPSLAHDGVLAVHPPIEGTLQLGAQGELLHVCRLLLVKDDALLAKGLVLHTIEALLDVADLGVGRVARPDGWREGWRHAVGAVSDRSPRRWRHDGARRI